MDRELKKIYIIKAINKMENEKCLDFIYGFICTNYSCLNLKYSI